MQCISLPSCGLCFSGSLLSKYLETLICAFVFIRAAVLNSVLEAVIQYSLFRTLCTEEVVQATQVLHSRAVICALAV